MLGNHASRNGVKSSSLTIAVLVVVSHPVSAQVATFQGLGDFPGGGFYSEANGVSADGSTVVGFSRHTRNEAFVWTFSGGMVGLGNQPGAELIYPSYGHAISGDGSVIIGTGSSSTNTEAFLWTADTGIIGLGYLGGTLPDSYALSLSDDGTVALGWSYGASGQQNFLWTIESGIVGFVDDDGLPCYCLDRLSADGSVLIGVDLNPAGTGLQAAIYTSDGQSFGLGDLPGGKFQSDVSGLSGDGTVVVGLGTTASGFEAFRWTAGTGMIGLGVGSGTRSAAYAVSDDGAVIVGAVDTTLGVEAMIWDTRRGMRVLREVLVNEYGLDLTGWTLTAPTDVSADGSTIVGDGINPDGWSEAWIVTLPASCPADTDESGEVDVVDLIELLTRWGPCAMLCPPDSNADGAVNVPDLLAMLNAWGPCP